MRRQRGVNKIDINGQAISIASRNGEPQRYKISSNARFDSNAISTKRTRINRRTSPQIRASATAGHNRHDHKRFDFGLGYRPKEHFIEPSVTHNNLHKRPKSSLGGATKKYWENRKGTPYKNLLRENLSKGLDTYKNKTRKPKMIRTWSCEPVHQQVSTKPEKHDRTHSSVAWRENYSKLQTTQKKPHIINRTTGIWECNTVNAVLHDRPTSRGFIAGTPKLVRTRSAPELNRIQIHQTRMPNYDYFHHMPVSNGRSKF